MKIQREWREPRTHVNTNATRAKRSLTDASCCCLLSTRFGRGDTRDRGGGPPPVLRFGTSTAVQWKRRPRPLRNRRTQYSAIVMIVIIIIIAVGRRHTTSASAINIGIGTYYTYLIILLLTESFIIVMLLIEFRQVGILLGD